MEMAGEMMMIMTGAEMGGIALHPMRTQLGAAGGEGRERPRGKPSTAKKMARQGKGCRERRKAKPRQAREGREREEEWPGSEREREGRK